MYNVADTLKLAKDAGVTQVAIAQALQIPESHLSGFKNGRPCSAEKHAQIAYAAGLTTRARLILLESVIEATGADTELRGQLQAIIKGLPNERHTIATAPVKGASARGVATDKPRLRKTLRTSMKRLRRRFEVGTEHRGKNRAIGPFFTPGFCTEYRLGCEPVTGRDFAPCCRACVIFGLNDV